MMCHLHLTLIHIDSSDLPVRLLQHFRLGLDPRIARKNGIFIDIELFGFLAAIPKVPIAGHIATECQIEDYSHVLKVIRRTSRALTDRKVRIRQSPQVWIRSGAIVLAGRVHGLLQVGGQCVFRKRPAANVSIRRVPFQGVHSATPLVEWFPNRSFLIINGNTALVLPLVRSHCPAVIGFFLGIKVWQPSIRVGNASWFQARGTQYKALVHIYHNNRMSIHSSRRHLLAQSQVPVLAYADFKRRQE